VTRRKVGCFLLALLFALAARTVPGLPPDPDSGVVVEKTTPGFEAAKAGFQAGDVLLGWERAPNPPANPTSESGVFRSPFDVQEAYVDQAPRARTLTFRLTRDGQKVSVPVLQYPWGLETRPRFSEERLLRYELGKQTIAQGERERGLDVWRTLAGDLSGAKRHVEAAWLWARISKAQSEAKENDAAIASLDRALAAARPAGRRDIDAQLWGSKVEVLRGANRQEDARSAARQAMAIREQLAPSSLAVAHTIHELSSVMPREKPEYETINRRALGIREKLAPGSRAVATSLLNLSFVADAHGDSRTAVELNQRALAIHQSLNPGSRDVAKTLSNICVEEMNRGELASAEDYCERSLQIWRALGPGDLGGVAQVLHNTGVLVRLQGDLDRAETLFFESIEVCGRIPPNAPGYHPGYNYFELAITELERDIDKAEEYLDRAEQLQGKMEAGGSTSGALRAFTRASIAYQRKDLVGAEKLLRQAIAYFDATAPNHPIAGYIRDDLGRVLTERGLSSEAEESIRRALAQRQVYGPGSQETAQSYYNLGMLLWKTGRLVEAEAALRQAIEEYEAQKGKLDGSDESQSMIAGRFADFYKDYQRLLVELHRERDAFLILERYRAGSFLRMLARRDFHLPDEVPAALDQERRSINSEYDRTQADLQALDPESQARELASALARLAELRRKQDDTAERITRASPRYGALRYPRPLDVAGAQTALAPGTLLLSYAVGREKSYLFVLPGGPGGSLEVHALPLGEKELRASVDAFRRLIQWNREGPELAARGRTLYEQLLEPAQKRIAAADRLLIIADGPLHKLPWAALATDAARGHGHFLGEWKPIHTAPSVTAYAELKKSRPQSSSGSLLTVAAFGDPKYPATPGRDKAAQRGAGDSIESEAGPPGVEGKDAEDSQLRSVLRGGFDLAPLPESRAEVAAIAALYSPKAVAYLGADATEERAASIGPDVPLIHYACHALVNERFPLDSALVFTIPDKPRKGQDNGLLQAWEIFERMHIDADLVTLSACESGLGKEMAGEGLIGLTRAFQYAGARSVLSSLWKVDDKATAELMKRFYGYLKAGRPKDEALRLAQVDLIRSADFSQPRDWAAFQLNGDWK